MSAKYSNKKLQQLANGDLIWPKKSSHYERILKQSIEQKGWDYSQLHDGAQVSDVVHEDLWFDTCKIINELSQMVLDEREYRVNFIAHVKADLQDTISCLNTRKQTP